jgi:pre-mRNA-splicing factor ISY1
MARPAEKARSMLNKWTAMREADSAPKPRRSKRPHLASECDHLADAERFRNQIVREIAEGVAKIQNPGLGEHAIRELNDEINHKIREKFHWNKRIKELGGLDYNAIEKQRQVEEGNAVSEGYRYFGAAKDLPGVKELLAKQEAKQLKVKRTDLHKNLSVDYYGWRDEEDGVLLELEAVVDKKNEQLRKKQKTGKPKVVDEEEEDYLAVPSQLEVDRALLEQKKKSLLSKYDL